LKKPHCDIETGEIYGCEHYSKNWWHEKGHIEFNKHPSTSALIMWQGIAHLLWMISLTLAFLNPFMLWIAFPMLFLYVAVDVYEEYWCNRYAKYNFKDSKKKTK